MSQVKQMAKFELAIPEILKHEGGLVDNRNDPGGITNFGISKRSFPEVDIKNLTKEQAIDIYRKTYWTPYHEACKDQAVATKWFDITVNMGAVAANRIVQTAVKRLGNPFVTVDGNVGPITLCAVNTADPVALLSGIRYEQWSHYEELMKKNPKLEAFRKGWYARAYS
jgi:lysozyme family protein